MAETKIPYCDATWDLTIGCRKRSPGCLNCWATRTVHRLARRGVRGYCGQEESANGLPPYLLQTSLDGKNWKPMAYVNHLYHNVDKPLQWKSPRFIFVNSKGDLFDERVRFEFIGAAFDVMAQAKQHRYMILTKEPGRLAEFIDWYSTDGRRRMGASWPDDFPHVILMTSVEDAEHLGRIKTLLRIPAVHYGVSFEPLLGQLAPGLLRYLADIQCSKCGWLGFGDNDTPDQDGHWECPSCKASVERCVYDYSAVHNFFGADPRLDWVIIGGEKLIGGCAGRWAGEDPEAWWYEAAAMAKILRHAGVATWMKQGPVRQDGRIVVSSDVTDFPTNCRIQQPQPWSP